MSDDDAAVEVLGAHAVLVEPTAETWHAVAHGQLPPDSARSRVLAGRDADEAEQAELGRAMQVFAPPSEERRRAGLEALLARRAAEAEREAVVLPLRPRRTSRWAAGLLAAAASVALVVWLTPSRPEDAGAFPGGYAIELEKAAASMRGAEPGPEVPSFLLDGAIGILLVPERAIEGPIGVVAYAWNGEEPPRRLEVQPTVHRDGVVELDTTVKALGLEVGEWELVIAIGWAGALPVAWEEIESAEHAADSSFEVVRTRVRVVTRLSERRGNE